MQKNSLFFFIFQFLVTLIVFPENHPAHAAFLKEHDCVGVLQPKI